MRRLNLVERIGEQTWRNRRLLDHELQGMLVHDVSNLMQKKNKKGLSRIFSSTPGVPRALGIGRFESFFVNWTRSAHANPATPRRKLGCVPNNGAR